MCKRCEVVYATSWGLNHGISSVPIKVSAILTTPIIIASST